MEQQNQFQAEQTRPPEQARLSEAGLTAQLAAQGVSLFGLPPSRLEELAGLIGNSAMQSLLDARTLPVRETGFRMPAAEPETAPFQVPKGQPPALAHPVGLTAVEAAGTAADPGALTV